jgi:hypothetical protein
MLLCAQPPSQEERGLCLGRLPWEVETAQLCRQPAVLMTVMWLFACHTLAAKAEPAESAGH